MSHYAVHLPGEPEVEDAQVGDFVLTHSQGFYGKLIRFGQAFRFRGDRKPFARWGHAALVVGTGPEGGVELAEALGHGVVQQPLSKYDGTEYALVRSGVDGHDQLQVREFATRVVSAKTRYGFLEIVSLGLTLLTPGIPIQFGSPGTSICSGFVAEALTRAGEVFGVSPEYATPADLAEHFDVRLGTSA